MRINFLKVSRTLGRLPQDFLSGLALSALLLVPALTSSALAASSQIILHQDTDFYGFDIRTEKNISLENCKENCLSLSKCRAFTYNTKARYCFLKSDFSKAVEFPGAIAGQVVLSNTEKDLGHAPAMELITDKLSLAAEQFTHALQKSLKLDPKIGRNNYLSLAEQALRTEEYQLATTHLSRALAIDPDDCQSWNTLSFAAENWSRTPKISNKSKRVAQNTALLAAVNAYNQSHFRKERAEALLNLGRGLKLKGTPRDAMKAFKASLELEEKVWLRADYDQMVRKYAFRLVEHTIDEDVASPRVCFQFSEDVKKDYNDFSSYIRVDTRAPKALDVSKSQICVEGLEHGQQYDIDLRQGLPAENGESLLANKQLSVYVGDRSASMRFTGSNYVLPASDRHGIPLVSVNSDATKLALYRVSDRSLAELLRGSRFLSQLSTWRLNDMIDDLGNPVWQGEMAISDDLNKEVMTSIPIDEALPTRKPGLYLITAKPAKVSINDDGADYGAQASQWFVISDIGLTTFSSPASSADKDGAPLGGMQVFTRSLKSADPLSGVQVELIARNNDVLGKGVSDENGLVSFDAGLMRGKDGLAPALITAQNNGEDFVFLDLSKPGFDLSDRGVGGRTAPDGVDVYAWTERGVYRPGEVVHVNALARDSKVKAVSDLPLTFKFERPDGVETDRLVGSGSALGGYSVDLALPTNAPRGTWDVRILADPKKPALVTKRFLVEDFEPERTDMTISARNPAIDRDKANAVDVEGRYLYGAPAAGLSLDGEVVVRETRKREGFKGYFFGLDEEEISTAERFDLSKTEKLDKDGKGEVVFSLNDLTETTRPLEAQLVLSMIESGGRSITRRQAFPVLAKNVMIGIRPLFEDGQAAENSNADFNLAAVNAEGKQIDLSGLHWSLVRLENHYQWYRDEGTWHYEVAEIEEKVADGKLDLKAAGLAKLSLPVEWGRYRLNIEEPEQAEIASSYSFDAGWYVDNGSMDSPDGLEMALDKQSYKAGDVAKLTISPRYAGKLLLALGTDRIVQTMAVDVPATGTSIDIPVRKDWGAGVYALATLYRPSGDGQSRNPARALGVKWLAVGPEERALSIKLDPPALTRPHEEINIPVQVEGLQPGEEAYVNLALVDTGILNITNYQSPDPVKNYFGQRNLGVDIHDLYGRLIDGNAGVMGTLRTGGDGFEDESAANNAPEEKQELVSFVSGIIRLDDEGKANIAFELPQFNGEARIMAIAWTKDAVGAEENVANIREPIVVTASLPRFMAPEDQSEIYLELNDKDAPEGTYSLRFETNEALSIAPEDASRDIQLKKDEVLRLSVPVKAEKVASGKISLYLRPSLGSEDVSGDNASEDVIEHILYVPVRSASLPVTQLHKTMLEARDGAVTISPDLLTGYDLSGALVSVSVTQKGVYDIAGLLTQLENYPYGCAEQTTSKTMPLLYGPLLYQNMPESMDKPTKPELDKRIDKAIAKLMSYQSSNGGFSLWGGYRSDPWLSAYVSDFLTRAREQGYNVPQKPFEAALNHIRNGLSYRVDLDSEPEALAYGLYVLARNRMASIGDLRYYVDTKLEAFPSALARAQLGAALALYADPARAEKAFASAYDFLKKDEKSGDVDLPYSFGSDQRDLAATLNLVLETKPMPASGNALLELARASYDPARRASTQEMAWMLMAARAGLDQNSDLSLDVNGQMHKGAYFGQFTAESLANLSSVITNKGDDELEARISVVATPSTPLPAGGDGFAISRSYFHLDGQPASMSEVKQNERFVVLLQAHQIDKRAARIMISDLLPAGLEVENPSLLGGNDLKALSWVKPTNVAHVEFRSDRVMAAFDHNLGDADSFIIAYVVRAVTPGLFTHPAAVIEDMYRPEFAARTASGFMNVVKP